ncbi:hypothetical protein [Micromonospora profundi]|uniref:hypothetical protein n=1 Tax=Micromonospora profundi TaxID=1420889 RepID=UPI003657E56B
MADQTRAADLPGLSVVATDTNAYIKDRPTRTAQWRGTNGGYFADRHIDDLLGAGGGQVLRVGTGQAAGHG